MSVSLGLVIGKTECLILHSDIVLACFQRWKSWILFKMRWCSTAIYNNQSTGQVEENKGIHHKEIWLLKEKKESSTDTWIYVRRARSSSIFAHVTDWIWVIPKIKLWSGIMIQCFLSLMYFTVPNYLRFFQSFSLW